MILNEMMFGFIRIFHLYTILISAKRLNTYQLQTDGRGILEGAKIWPFYIQSKLVPSGPKIIECRGTMNNGSTIFRSEGYPTQITTSGICVLDINPVQSTCAIRVEPIDLNLHPPVKEACDSQRFFINGPALSNQEDNKGSYSICGYLNDRIYNFPINKSVDSQKISIGIIFQPPLSFNIKVTTIPCSNITQLQNLARCGMTFNHQQRKRTQRRLSLKGNRKKTLNHRTTENDTKNPKRRKRNSYFHIIMKKRGYDPDLSGMRVIGGRSAIPGHWPWIVNIYENGKSICGGSLITSKMVLTAQHCIEYVRAKDLVIYLGNHNYTKGFEEHNVVRRSVIKIYPHYKYDWYTVDSDITILEMNQEVTFNQNINPICLPLPNEIIDLKGDFKSAGWGIEDNDVGIKSTYLQEINMKYVDYETCLQKWSDAEEVRPGIPSITKNMICMEANDKFFGICYGDSGGPLTKRGRSGRKILIGAVSFSLRCASKVPQVFTKISEFLKWINVGLS